VKKGAEVKTGTAAENRKAAAGGDLGEEGADFGDEVTGGEVVGWGAEIDEMVGDAALLGNRYFGGTDIETGVNLDGIKVDDFAVKTFGERESQRRLPCSGGSSDGKEGEVWHWEVAGVPLGFTILYFQ
jgi:hypothetical protein